MSVFVSLWNRGFTCREEKTTCIRNTLGSCVGDQVGMNFGEGWLNEWLYDRLTQGLKTCAKDCKAQAASDAYQAWIWERFQKLEQVDR
jgi:hypothetical protein